jgi:hypothetical protein
MAGRSYRISSSDGRYAIGHVVSLSVIVTAAAGYFLMFALLRRLNVKREAVLINERVREIGTGMKRNSHPNFSYTA